VVEYEEEVCFSSSAVFLKGTWVSGGNSEDLIWGTFLAAGDSLNAAETRRTAVEGQGCGNEMEKG